MRCTNNEVYLILNMCLIMRWWTLCVLSTCSLEDTHHLTMRQALKLNFVRIKGGERAYSKWHFSYGYTMTVSAVWLM